MLGKRLAYLRGSLTQDEVAGSLGISRARYSHYETGRSEPDTEILGKIAVFFKSSTDYLLGLSDSPSYKHLRLPILGTIRTGVPLLAQEEFQGYIEVPDYFDTDFAFKVTGDQMIGVGILEGDYAICKAADHAQSGQIVLALKDLDTGFREAALKYYFDNGKKCYLRSANPQIRDIPMEGDYQVAGIMAGLLRKDAPGYHLYRDYLNSCGNGDWGEVREKALSYGITPQQLSSTLDMQWEMAKKLNAKD